MKFTRSSAAKSPHDNLFLNLPEYGSFERVEKVALLTRILQDYATTEFPDMVQYCRKPEQYEWFHASFGEHYKLINSLCKSLQINKVVEVGSFTGMSALIWLLNSVALTSIDIVPWRDFEESVLSDDIVNGNLFNQKIMNLLDDSRFSEMIPEFMTCDLIFLDGPKDGVFEQKIVPKLLDCMSGSGSWLLLDDIHLRAMKPCWDAIENEKYDLSLIGHSSGTGLVRF
jgi:predicted O-methyltransferase YrrM